MDDKKNAVKTNAMRMLDAVKISYKAMFYDWDENDLSGTKVAEAIGLPCETVFKTLVAKGDKTGFLVFCIPADAELDLKKAAKHSGNKRVELLPVKELLSVTGYIRGGCSPVGMKKPFPTYFDESCILFDEITVSAGVRGCQLLINTEALLEFVGGKECPLTME
ncbi:MAG: Cys-tRNA(Pro) deacylase [Clostridia bacterium]|nr:Cys-tRNA(Pro) deacylase [Clostridia bacterium]